MVKVLDKKQGEVIFTVELTQKELNTLARSLGVQSESYFEETILTGPYVNSNKLLTSEETFQLFDLLADEATYTKFD